MEGEEKEEGRGVCGSYVGTVGTDSIGKWFFEIVVLWDGD